jgi:hypothetical protein
LIKTFHYGSKQHRFDQSKNKKKVKRGPDDKCKSSSSLKNSRRLVLLPPSKLEITLISSPNETMKIPPHTLHVVLLPRENKSSFVALKILLQEAKTHAQLVTLVSVQPLSSLKHYKA